MRVYVAKTWVDGCSNLMIYDHKTKAASWGRAFYCVEFKKLKKYWTLVGNFDS